MYTDALGVTLFIFFVNVINEVKCRGLSEKNFELSCKVDDLEQRSNLLLSHIHWLELGIANVERENNELFNYIFKYQTPWGGGTV